MSTEHTPGKAEFPTDEIYRALADITGLPASQTGTPVPKELIIADDDPRYIGIEP